MSDVPARNDGTFRFVFDGAMILALMMQIGAGLYWAGIIHQQMQDVTARVDAMQKQNQERAATVTSVAVRLGRIEQKLTDIGQKVGVP